MEQLLVEGMKELGINAESNVVDKFIKYMNMLKEWNQKINITAVDEDRDIIIKHFLDSLSISKFIDKGKSIIDIGTGGGFPGIPIKLVSENSRITLVDSLNKRVFFLYEVIKELHLNNMEAVHSRAEDLGVNRVYREKYDICVSRAVASLSVLSEYCLPFVKPGGSFIAYKGKDIEKELQESTKAISELGGKLEEKVYVKIPFSDITHSLLIIKKIGQTPTKYPRKAGKPAKQPIK